MAADYRDLEIVGQGGMAKVFRAEDPELGRPVAIKELSAELAGNERHLVKFVAEGRKMASINHPNVVQIYSIQDDGDRPPRLIMELAEGTLLDHFKAGPLEVTRVERIGRQVLLGLEAIHRAQWIHRDIKPANILYFDNGLFKIADFGIATGGEDHTQLLATPKYMAPEMLTRPRLVGPASDLYGLGLVLYEALVGPERLREIVERLCPMDDGTIGSQAEPANAAASRHLWQTFHAGPEELPPVRQVRSDVPEAFSEWLVQLTRKDIAERFQTCREALVTLKRDLPSRETPTLVGVEATQKVRLAADGPAGTGRPGWVVVLATVLGTLLVTVLIGVVWLLLRGSQWSAHERESTLGDSVETSSLVRSAHPEPVDTEPPDPEVESEVPEPFREIPLRLTSDPSGAWLLVDGLSVGRTPLERAVREGARLELSLEGFATTALVAPTPKTTDRASEGVQVADPHHLHRELIWQQAVRIDSRPAGAQVRDEFSEGGNLGITPVDYRGRGESAQIELTLEGFEPISLRLEPGQSIEPVKLLPKLPKPDIPSSPDQLPAALTPFLSHGEKNGGVRLQLLDGQEPTSRLVFGQRLRLRAEVDRAVHAALLLVQSNGDALLLYPSPRGGDLRLAAQSVTDLPLPAHVDAGFRLMASEPAGQDHVYLLTSTAPLPDPPHGRVFGEWSTLFAFTPDDPESSSARLIRWVAEQVRAGEITGDLTALTLLIMTVEPGDLVPGGLEQGELESGDPP